MEEISDLSRLQEDLRKIANLIESLNSEINIIKFSKNDTFSEENQQKLIDCNKIYDILQIEKMNLLAIQTAYREVQYQLVEIERELYTHKVILQCLICERDYDSLETSALSPEEYTAIFVSLLYYLTLIKISKDFISGAQKINFSNLSTALFGMFLSPFGITTGLGILALQSFFDQKLFMQTSNVHSLLMVNSSFNSNEVITGYIQSYLNDECADHLLSNEVEKKSNIVDIFHSDKDLQILQKEFERKQKIVSDLESILKSLKQNRENYMRDENKILESNYVALQLRYKKIQKNIKNLSYSKEAAEKKILFLNKCFSTNIAREISILSESCQEKYARYKDEELYLISKKIRLCVLKTLEYLCAHHYSDIDHQVVENFYVDIDELVKANAGQVTIVKTHTLSISKPVVARTSHKYKEPSRTIAHQKKEDWERLKATEMQSEAERLEEIERVSNRKALEQQKSSLEKQADFNNNHFKRGSLVTEVTNNTVGILRK